MILNTLNKKIFFLFISFCSLVIRSQTKKIDSLKEVIPAHTYNDSVKVNSFNTIAFESYGINIDTTYAYALKANLLAKENQFIKGEAYSLYYLGLVNLDRHNKTEAKENVTKAIDLFSSIQNKTGLSQSYNLLGLINYSQKNYIKTKTYLDKSIKIATQTKNKLQEAITTYSLAKYYKKNNDYEKSILCIKKSLKIYDSLNNHKQSGSPYNLMGIILKEQGKYLESLKNLKKSLELENKNKNKRKAVGVLMNIGVIYNNLKQNSKAISYYKKALKLSTELNNKLVISYCYINIGLIEEENKNYPEALSLYNKALTLNNEINNNEGEYYCYENIANLNNNINNLDKALLNYKKSLSISKKLRNDELKCSTLSNLSEVYYKLKEYQLSLQTTIEAKKLAYKLNLIKEQKKIHQLLSKLYKIKGNYKKAYENQLQFKTLSDSLFNKKTIEKLTQLEYEYKYKQEKDSANKRELKLTQKVKITTKNLEKSQKNIFLSIILFLLTSILLLIGLFFFKIRHIKAKNENILTEQKLLRSQMTPHFIFNSLAVLQGIILNNEAEKSVSYLSKFSKLLRIILENSRDSVVLLSKELKAIENYLALQNIYNSETPYKYKIEIDSSIDKENLYIPPMLIQPFIENAIEHAFIGEEKNKEICIFINLINTELICVISDNGIGINSHKKEKKNGKKSLATIITSERLAILSKKYKMKGSIKIKDKQKEKGTLITLTIPYKLKQND